jgi:hypothetical protein
MKDFFKSLFKPKVVVNVDMYSNAYLYNLLGQDYDKIMTYGLGKGWISEKTINLHEKVNNLIDSDFTKEDTHENILYKLKGLYKNSLVPTNVVNDKIEENGTSGKV